MKAFALSEEEFSKCYRTLYFSRCNKISHVVDSDEGINFKRGKRQNAQKTILYYLKKSCPLLCWSTLHFNESYIIFALFLMSSFLARWQWLLCFRSQHHQTLKSCLAGSRETRKKNGLSEPSRRWRKSCEKTKVLSKF